ncbi:hypothetical protein C8Q76DRAFT_698188 [Earliella scabrosa]|nr:hypothetical protein C8Q76DRAFT_698188 [Earliella scabrosa]
MSAPTTAPRVFPRDFLNPPVEPSASHAAATIPSISSTTPAFVDDVSLSESADLSSELSSVAGSTGSRSPLNSPASDDNDGVSDGSGCVDCGEQCCTSECIDCAAASGCPVCDIEVSSMTALPGQQAEAPSIWPQDLPSSSTLSSIPYLTMQSICSGISELSSLEGFPTLATGCTRGGLQSDVQGSIVRLGSPVSGPTGDVGSALPVELPWIQSSYPLQSPSPQAVYDSVGVDGAHGQGLRALPDTRMKVMPKVSYSILALLAIAGSPQLCLSAREIAAAIEARYPDVLARRGKGWKQALLNCMQRHVCFAVAPGTGRLPEADQLWYINFWHWPPNIAPYRKRVYPPRVVSKATQPDRSR